MTDQLATERLLLRRWRDADRPAFAAMGADARVMEHFESALDRAASDAMIDRIEAHFEAHGFGFWAVEVPGVTPFAGFVGLVRPRFDAHFTPCVEIGWRLAHAYWGRGYASEAARACLRFGFETACLDAIVAMTVPSNVRSRRVMEGLGMTRDPADDFDHPHVADGHPLKRHVLYRLARPR